jgi:hypothetical protein
LPINWLIICQGIGLSFAKVLAHYFAKVLAHLLLRYWLILCQGIGLCNFVVINASDGSLLFPDYYTSQQQVSSAVWQL